MYKINTEFEEAPIESTVGDANTSGRIYVPKELIGRKVVVACIPDSVKSNKVGMSTEHLVRKLTDSIGMSVEEWNIVYEKCAPICRLSASDCNSDIHYDDAVNELLEFIESLGIGEMSPQYAFCCGAFVGITYQPHMLKEFDNKFDSLIVS